MNTTITRRIHYCLTRVYLNYDFYSAGLFLCSLFSVVYFCFVLHLITIESYLCDYKLHLYTYMYIQWNTTQIYTHTQRIYKIQFASIINVIFRFCWFRLLYDFLWCLKLIPKTGGYHTKSSNILIRWIFDVSTCTPPNIWTRFCLFVYLDRCDRRCRSGREKEHGMGFILKRIIIVQNTHHTHACLHNTQTKQTNTLKRSTLIALFARWLFFSVVFFLPCVLFSWFCFCFSAIIITRFISRFLKIAFQPCAYTQHIICITVFFSLRFAYQSGKRASERASKQARA